MEGIRPYGLLLLAILSCKLLTAQLSDSLRFKRLGMEDGLPDAQITGIVQDKDGFLWIGTSNGLSRYDGTEFRNFFYDREKNALPGNNITNILSYDSNHLVIATTTGLSLLNIHTLQFRNFLVKSKPVMFSRDNSFRSVVVDSFHNIWAGTRTALYCLSPQLDILKVYRGYSEKDYNQERMNYVGILELLPGNEILATLEDRHTDQGGLMVYNYQADTLRPLRTLTRHPYHILSDFISGGRYFNEKGNIQFIKFGDDSLSIFDPVTQTLQSRQFLLQNTVMGYKNQAIHLVKAGDQSLVCVFQEGGFSNLPSSFITQKGTIHLFRQFADKTINAIREDKAGTLWLATSNGLFKSVGTSKMYNPSCWITISKPFGIFGRYILLMIPYGWRQKPPVFKLTKELTLLDNIVMNKDPLYRIAWSVLKTGAKDTLWLNTQVGARWYNPATKSTGLLAIKGKPAALDEKPVTVAFKDSKGLTWMGIGFGNGVAQYNPASRTFIHYPSREGDNRLPIRYPLAIAEDHESNLWMGNQDGAGLVQWKRNLNHFEIITPDYFSLFDNAFINALYCNQKEVLWIATNNGLFSYHIPTHHFTKYDVAQGLPSNAITSITADDKGRIWIGTSNGLSCFQVSENRFVNFMHPNSLPETGITDVVFDPRSRKIFFTTNHYLNTFYPDQLMAESPALTIKITNVTIDNADQPVRPNYVIPTTRMILASALPPSTWPMVH
ncbi:ligand-binding sensor domain-containing protein [Paraflavitalea speifideaquila]|uniref:ligand-binding sensor domain-containing protein n=1 Tax=Paraflavitalea speifideaquila TaxID=3076558 RepID=UPI0028F0C66D|nr:two-component regulator propeller domain-containing protein [Paraflavitalea speifideiaquila]